MDESKVVVKNEKVERKHIVRPKTEASEAPVKPPSNSDKQHRKREAENSATAGKHKRFKQEED